MWFDYQTFIKIIQYIISDITAKQFCVIQNVTYSLILNSQSIIKM